MILILLTWNEYTYAIWFGTSNQMTLIQLWKAVRMAKRPAHEESYKLYVRNPDSWGTFEKMLLQK
jgi:hypothetical protein